MVAMVVLGLLLAGAADAGATGAVGTQDPAAAMALQAGDVTIDNPNGTYVLGSEVTVNGTASSSADAVALYARTSGDWDLVDIDESGALDEDDLVEVDENGTWERREVLLSNATSDFKIPGHALLGALPADDARNEAGDLQVTFTRSAFVEADGAQARLDVVRPTLAEQTVFRAIDGEVAVPDGEVTVAGTATGVNRVLVVLVDQRGQVATDTLPVSDDKFEADVDLESHDGGQFFQGTVVGVVIHAGPDRLVGDGVLAEGGRPDLPGLEAYFRDAVEAMGATRSQDQVLDVLFAESIAESGSDDIATEESFRFADARTTIVDVVPAVDRDASGVNPVGVGETMVVRGVTNRKPGDNTIFVEVTGGPTPEAFDLMSVDQWDTDGAWTVRFDTTDATPGTYFVEADDGVAGDSATVEIITER
ncbi:hypothetical protein ACFQH6_18395 [Halobacteriaceae archaeon GCM10025711]